MVRESVGRCSVMRCRPDRVDSNDDCWPASTVSVDDLK